MGTFDLDLVSNLCTFSIQAIYFEWLDLATLFSVSETHLQNIWVMVQFQGHASKRSRSQQRKIGSMRLKNYWLEIAGA